MNTIAILQTIVAYLIGIFSLVMVNNILSGYLRRRFDISEQNIAYGILQTSIIIATALILSSVIDPGVSAIKLTNQGENTFTGIILSFGYVFLFMIIGVLFTLITIASSVFILFQMTHVNEWAEIKNNNYVISMISGAIIIGLSIIIDSYVGNLCEAIVPYPDVITIH
jgi:uncharacterized membrane protein YjfL (UPF0719 family)